LGLKNADRAGKAAYVEACTELRMLETASSSKRIDPHTAAALVRRLLTEYGFTRWKRYVFAFVLMGIGAACTALTAYLIRDIVNEAYVQKNFPGVVQIAVLTFLLFVIRGLSNYGHAVVLLRIGNSIVAENQRRMFSGLLQQNIGFFADHHSSEFAARLTAGAQAATQALNLLITALGRDLLTLIGLLAVMIWQDPIMSLFAFVIAPPLGIVMRKLTRRVRTVAHNQWAGGARILETLLETLQGMRIVKAFTLEDAVRARFQSHVADVERESNKMARVSQRVHPFTEGLGGFAAMLIMVYAGYSTIYGGATPGQFVSFMSALLLAYEPAKRLARLNLDLNATLVGVRVLFEIIDRPLTEPRDDTRPALTLSTARVEFSHVGFAYREGEPVLRDISFIAEPGQVTALVGPSGGGKSTILNLIIRFYQAQGGAITIDGQDIATVSRRSLRQQIAFVGQDTFLFRASVRDNIAFGRPGASEAEIIAAAKAAHAHDFIMSFPNGYDTEVGEQGLKLSGGERQRVAIARALIKNAPIILLDEATAALDAQSERYVQEAIAELCRGRTTLAIAHRLSTIMHADRILVIDGGQVVESGRHDELLRNNGRYALFHKLQFQRHELDESASTVPERV
jgi:ATP-binding cassette subfamily B protein